MRVAIIGAGPRGLWAVEELLDASDTNWVDLDIDVYEQGVPGAGSAYSTDQPDYWRLNVASSIVTTAWTSFDRWRRDGGEDLPLDPFPPRALVGAFLAQAWERCARRGVTTFHRRVESVEQLASGWRVEGRVYDELLVTTGHATGRRGTLSGIYPHGQLDAVAPGAVVAVRGMALTFIDAALALSLGRGGRVENGVYVRGGGEPSLIIPTSRSGRLMEVKPDPAGDLAKLDLDAIVHRGSLAVRAAVDLHGIRTALLAAARGILGRAESVADLGDFPAVLDGTDASGDPVAEFRLSRDVAVGRVRPGARWAVGEAWRRLYPAIVHRVSYRDPLPGFAELARRMERVAFGPPPVNADIILALIDAGLIDTSADPSVADLLVDATTAPPGVAAGGVVDKLGVRRGGRAAIVDRDGSVPGFAHLAIVGRDAADRVLGPDTLSRTLHDVIPRWARRVVAAAGTPPLDRGMGATVPLSARLEPWMVAVAADPRRCDRLLESHGSPVNLLRPPLMEGRVRELIDAGRDAGVDTRIFFARKANKALSLVDAVRNGGHGVDVASERELRQVLSRSVPGRRIILSAAIKPDSLLELAITSDVCISVDSLAELARVGELASFHKRIARVAPRLAPDPRTLPPTRFGELLDVWLGAETGASIGVVGVHLHLHGYAAADRRAALTEAFALADAHPGCEFIDLGGGVPMSYLDDPAQWRAFRAALRAGADFTWKNDPLTATYPFHQSPTRGRWLSEVLAEPIARGFVSRGLRLHLEPGRSILDGCGMTLARVAFLKRRSDGVPLIGLEMNRTQCRTTSDDILLDPILIPTGRPAANGWGPGAEGYLVGAYCIEDEVIVRRRMRFPRGVAPGDIVAIPNTAGYFMHILESASHQIPLARNVVMTGPEPGAEMLDDIDLPG
ncbi:FAD/NAD(P)-binding protein [Corynebacterium pacaense]|uniref:FAD/NAD(P)-binding protein n=1 Tax=Corynebacterium pacaense TaxID=1816684 RepID=UPI0009BC2BD6|nr:FAD/NAD(P)-binding protein [Corynebacterium pacaense]